MATNAIISKTEESLVDSAELARAVAEPGDWLSFALTIMNRSLVIRGSRLALAFGGRPRFARPIFPVSRA